MKNAFDGFISSLDKAGQRTNKLEDGATQTSQSEVQRK